MDAKGKLVSESALIGLSFMEQVIGEASTKEDTSLLVENFDTLDIMTFSISTLTYIIRIEAERHNMTVEDYISDMRTEFHILIKDLESMPDEEED